MSTITCGHCRNTHTSAAEVRACYTGIAPSTPATPTSGAPTAVGGATQRQIDYLWDLLQKRPALQEVENLHRDVVSRLTIAEASYWISYALDQPVATTPEPTPEPAPEPTPAVVEIPDFDTIPDGRYAVGETGDESFFQVTRSRDGRIRLMRLHGSPGDWRKTKPSRQSFGWAMARISENPGAAMIRFGEIHEVCGRCCSPLTDPVSRSRKIGPDCALTMGLESHGDYADRHPELVSAY